MKNTCLFLGLIWSACTNSAFAQQTLSSWPTDPLDSYQKVLDAADCGKKLYVDDASIFTADDWVLLVQHRGAEAVGEECARYGKVESYSASGNFELLRVESVETQPLTGDEYILLKSCPSLFYYAAYYTPGNLDVPNRNTYGYQVVKVHFVDDDLTIDGDLVAPAWNESTGIGGVIAVVATGTISLEANIDASGAGFEGGEPNSADNTYTDQTDYELNNTEQTGEKGNGIVYGIDLEGRGALANAGGGGGGKNAGGGGGSNYGAGGRGGDQNGAAGGLYDEIGGEGGWPLRYEAPGRTQIFFGGGGGAGHRSQQGTTDPDESKGGAGGGIVLFLANRLEVEGTRSINASGANGHDAEPGDNGAGGGGGGGVVLLDIPTITTGSTGALTVKVNGGDGGDTDDADCTGPGGGGGGGVVWFRTATKPSIVTVEKNKGDHGDAQNCTNSPHNAGEGEDGTELFNLTYPKWYNGSESPI